jgi:25S rRNA (adenine2142-N1)-methyltransferase
MPRTRRRKLPVTVSEKHGSSSTPRTSRGVIRKFHSLLKRQKTAEGDGDTLATVNHEMEKLGGLETYQRMSCIGQSSDRGGGSQKILIRWLTQLGWDADEKKHK